MATKEELLEIDIESQQQQQHAQYIPDNTNATTTTATVTATATTKGRDHTTSEFNDSMINNTHDDGNDDNNEYTSMTEIASHNSNKLPSTHSTDPQTRMVTDSTTIDEEEETMEAREVVEQEEKRDEEDGQRRRLSLSKQQLRQERRKPGTNFKVITWNVWCMPFHSPRTLSNPYR